MKSDFVSCIDMVFGIDGSLDYRLRFVRLDLWRCRAHYCLETVTKTAPRNLAQILGTEPREQGSYSC